MKPIYDLIQENPMHIMVRDPQDRHIIGEIQQTAAHKFRAIGSYFDCTFSDLEYAKACFHRPAIHKTMHLSKSNQLNLSI